MLTLFFVCGVEPTVNMITTGILADILLGILIVEFGMMAQLVPMVAFLGRAYPRREIFFFGAAGLLLRYRICRRSKGKIERMKNNHEISKG